MIATTLTDKWMKAANEEIQFFRKTSAHGRKCESLIMPRLAFFRVPEYFDVNVLPMV
jgi:hypothetical protein